MRYLGRDNTWGYYLGWVALAACIGFAVGTSIAWLITDVEEAMNAPPPQVEWPEFRSLPNPQD